MCAALRVRRAEAEFLWRCQAARIATWGEAALDGRWRGVPSGESADWGNHAADLPPRRVASNDAL